MYVTSTIFVAKVLAAMQVLMTLDMPLSTTLALPVTSKPIESTVENMAWQAWIELPPEQKQQVKSRKVTPKSIFTLPLRVECPEGHKQVDTKCIPIVIGTNEVLIDLNALGLLVGNTQTEDLYDYDDVGEEITKPWPYGDEASGAAEAERSAEASRVELSAPTEEDEPLKFNIFKNKFNIFPEDLLEDYSSISNEGSEKQENVTVTTPQPANESSITTTNVATTSDLVSEASTLSEMNFSFYEQPEKSSSSALDSVSEERNTLTTLSDDGDFKINAISVPAFSFETQKENKLSVGHNESFIQLVTALMDTKGTTAIDDEDKPQENDIQTLLQTESFLPLLNQTTAATLQNTVLVESFPLTTAALQRTSEVSYDDSNFNVEEEITTLPNVKEQEMKINIKQEHTRSVIVSPIIPKENGSGDGDGDGDGDRDDDNDQFKDSTLETVTIDEPIETTTPTHMYETTIIEPHSSLSTTQQELESLLQQEQAEKHFEASQRVRNDQKYQNVVLKKSKVQPVEVLSTTTEATTKTSTTPSIVSAYLPTTTTTRSVDELISSTSETVTPLLTVHNESENNDRFYYQHFAKQGNEETQRSVTESKQQTATSTASTQAEASIAAVGITATETETFPLTSEINLAKELRLINELVKDRATTTTTTETPRASTRKTTFTLNSLSESSSEAKKPTLSTSQLWSKIMPLLTTSSTTPMPENSTIEKCQPNNQEKSIVPQTTEPTASVRSNRNSKIIRINGFNSISVAKTTPSDPKTAAATTTTTTTIPNESTPSSSNGNGGSTSNTTHDNTNEAYWWLPVTWRLNKSTNSEKQQAEHELKSEEEESLLLRFWSAYVPKSS